ncbi:MAG: TadE family protein [bacterium]
MKKSKGSIMMEFLLVMPIYFVLFGGTFWIGELFIHRQKLLQLDRNAAIHAGLRHNRGSMPITTLGLYFFGIPADADSPTLMDGKQMRALKTDKDQYPWAMAVGGKASMRAPMPPWTKGWLNVETLWNSLTLTLTEIQVTMQPLTSNNETTYNFLSAALMRTKGSEQGYRSWHPRQICDEGTPTVLSSVWYTKVYNADDPYKTVQQYRNNLSSLQDDTSKPSPPNRKDYERFWMYWTWSQRPFFIF